MDLNVILTVLEVHQLLHTDTVVAARLADMFGPAVSCRELLPVAVSFDCERTRLGCVRAEAPTCQTVSRVFALQLFQDGLAVVAIKPGVNKSKLILPETKQRLWSMWLAQCATCIGSSHQIRISR